MGFNILEYDFTLQLNSKKLPLVKFWLKISRKNTHSYLKRLLNPPPFLVIFLYKPRHSLYT